MLTLVSQEEDFCCKILQQKSISRKCSQLRVKNNPNNNNW